LLCRRMVFLYFVAESYFCCVVVLYFVWCECSGVSRVSVWLSEALERRESERDRGDKGEKLEQ